MPGFLIKFFTIYNIYIKSFHTTTIIQKLIVDVFTNEKIVTPNCLSDLPNCTQLACGNVKIHPQSPCSFWVPNYQWVGPMETGSKTWYACVAVKLFQSCLTLCNPMDCGLPGSSVHRIFQARILEWGTMHSSRGSS